MANISEVGRDIGSMLFGLGVAMTVGTLAGLLFYRAYPAFGSGNAVGIGFVLGGGAGLALGSLTWMFIQWSNKE